MNRKKMIMNRQKKDTNKSFLCVFFFKSTPEINLETYITDLL